MKIQIWSGNQQLEGFLNVDVRRLEGVDIIGHAADLSEIADGSMDTLFNSAFFEHLFDAH